jgi:hypothetical protein
LYNRNLLQNLRESLTHRNRNIHTGQGGFNTFYRCGTYKYRTHQKQKMWHILIIAELTKPGEPYAIAENEGQFAVNEILIGVFEATTDFEHRQ